MSKKELIYHLFANPSFIEGASRILDLGTTLQIYNESETELEADSKALYDDWKKVGDDIKSSVLKYEQKEA